MKNNNTKHVAAYIRKQLTDKGMVMDDFAAGMKSAYEDILEYIEDLDPKIAKKIVASTSRSH